MQRTVVVVDDFLNNALQLREAALKLEYPERNDRAYHGRNSNKRILIEGLDDMVSRLVGEPLQPIDPLHSHGRFRVTREGDEGLADIHIDQSHWSAILYLNKPEQCAGGTDFFVHKPTNMDRIPMDLDEVKALGFDSYEDLHAEVIGKHTKDRSKWEHVMRVPMRFNRLLLLRPWLYHTSGPGFGTTIEDSRLVYLMFFRPAPPPQRQGTGFVTSRLSR